jgi:uncharacterized SAM-binding protein YcdF (DUF218 family)
MSWGIVVPGHSRRGAGAVSARCRRLVEYAAELAATRAPAAVVFSGRAGRGRPPSEAEQMLAAWPGRRDVELVLETTAATTAQNAARTLPLLLERGITEATVVCGAAHAARVRYFFGRLYSAAGLRVEVVAAPILPTPAAVAWELGAVTVRRRQLQAALAELLTSRG